MKNLSLYTYLLCELETSFADEGNAGRKNLQKSSFMVLICIRGRVNPRAIVRPEGLGQLKNPMTSSEIKPATFRLVA
jgi:hypothetical protein